MGPHVLDHTRENTPPGVVQASASLSPHPWSDGVPPFAAPSEPTTEVASCHLFPPFVETRALTAPEPLATHATPTALPAAPMAADPRSPSLSGESALVLPITVRTNVLPPSVLRATRT